MKKLNKKGFTLVELLAVIVILAVIMVITIPTVLGSMGTAKGKAFDSAVAAVDKYISDQAELCSFADSTLAPYESTLFDKDCKFKLSGTNDANGVDTNIATLLSKAGYTGQMTITFTTETITWDHDNDTSTPEVTYKRSTDNKVATATGAGEFAGETY